MARARYWKMTPEEVEGLAYDQSLLLNWDIKCVRAPESEAVFVGVFMYRHGTPLDYAAVRGLAYYHNHMPPGDVSKITKHLRGRYGGKDRAKGDRVFLEGSAEFFDPGEIAALARSMAEEFDTVPTITLEFEGMDQDAMRAAGLPDAKLLPIPGK